MRKFSELEHLEADENHAQERSRGEPEARVAHLLQDIWFAALVGWTGGLHEPAQVVEQLKSATRLLFNRAQMK